MMLKNSSKKDHSIETMVLSYQQLHGNYGAVLPCNSSEKDHSIETMVLSYQQLHGNYGAVLPTTHGNYGAVLPCNSSEKDHSIETMVLSYQQLHGNYGAVLPTTPWKLWCCLTMQFFRERPLHRNNGAVSLSKVLRFYIC